MARRFRFYEKKRGHRHTGSQRFGTASELAFFAALCLLGVGGMVVMFRWFALPEWRVNQEFIPHTCLVLGKQLGEKEGPEGTLYRPEIKIEYCIGGETYAAWTYDIATAQGAANSYSPGKDDKQAALDRFAVDKEQPREYPCWYDPTDPTLVVVERGYSWWIWLAFSVPASFILIGSGGAVYAVLHWGKSAERRAAIARRLRQRDPLKANGEVRPGYPYVPDGSEISDSPGTRLKYRLPIGTSPGWKLFGTLVACVAWNGIVAALGAYAVHKHVRGEPDWVLTLFVVPFLVAGMGLIVYFVRQLVLATGIGPILVEVSEHPLQPGGRYRLFVSQAGRLTVRRLDVALVCEEQATYRQGTNTRTETREVYRQPLLLREHFEVAGGAPFETECELAVPPSAMHSFKAVHNEVQWKVVVAGQFAGWPELRRSFPVIVCPSNGSRP